MATIFSRIASGEIPSYRVASTADHYAFLDINPVVPGHVLVIPRREEEYIFNLADDELAGLSLFAKRVARAIEAAVPCRRVAVAVIGLEVPHAHIHLLPIQREGDVDFRHKAEVAPGEMEAIAKAIAAKYEELYPEK